MKDVIPICWFWQILCFSLLIEPGLLLKKASKKSLENEPVIRGGLVNVTSFEYHILHHFVKTTIVD